MKRIEDNEKRLNSLKQIVFQLKNDLDSFESNISEYQSLNQYYGSKDWFLDKTNFEKGKYPNLKAGVLSEDAVWNLDEEVSEILSQMKEILERMRS